MNKVFKVIFCALVLLISNTSAQSAHQNSLFSIENRLKFANNLYDEKDYLRAIGEYKEILKLVELDTIRYRFANSFMQIGRYEEASQNFKAIFIGSKLVDEAKLSYYQSLFLQSSYNTFRSNYENEFFLPQKYLTEIEKLNSIIYFFQKSNLPPVNLLIKPFEDSVHTKLIYFSQMIKNPPQKNPTTAALLSALIPGAGKYYTGKLTDGIIAFGATILSGFLALNSFQNDNQFRGWLFSGLTAFFYGGSIYGSAASAKIYNAKVTSDLNQEIKQYFTERNYFMPKFDF